VNEDGTLGEDKGNMSIDVDTLTITDQKNKEESWSEGYSFSTSMGGNFEQGGKAGLSPGNGSTAVGVNNSGHTKEGISYGVLGKTKSLKVAGEAVADDSEVLAGKHRDISETSVVTKEETTGGLSVDLTVSNELFVGGQRQARDDNGDVMYDENGNTVMKDMNGFEILKNDIGLIDDMVYTKDDGLGGNLKGAAVNVGRVAGAIARDAASAIKTTVTGNRDMTNAPGSNLANVYTQEHIERT